jgi:hypothetical protein
MSDAAAAAGTTTTGTGAAAGPTAAGVGGLAPSVEGASAPGEGDSLAFMTEKEFGRVLRYAFPDLSGEEISLRFRSCDYNGLGRVTEEEFVAWGEDNRDSMLAVRDAFFGFEGAGQHEPSGGGGGERKKDV